MALELDLRLLDALDLRLDLAAPGNGGGAVHHESLDPDPLLGD